MKIYDSQGVMFHQADKSARTNISEKSDFQTIMNGLTSSSESKEGNAPSNIQMPFANGVGIIYKEEPTSEKDEALNSLKDALDLVDFYADKLADSSVSSQDLSGLVEQLEERLDLLKELGSSTQMNDKLKTIISDLSTTMGVEIERFKRGDYI